MIVESELVESRQVGLVGEVVLGGAVGGQLPRSPQSLTRLVTELTVATRSVVLSVISLRSLAALPRIESTFAVVAETSVVTCSTGSRGETGGLKKAGVGPG